MEKYERVRFSISNIIQGVPITASDQKCRSSTSRQTGCIARSGAPLQTPLSQRRSDACGASGFAVDLQRTFSTQYIGSWACDAPSMCTFDGSNRNVQVMRYKIAH